MQGTLSMGIPITHIIIITATTLMVTFHSIMISAIFAISTGVTTRLTIGEEDTDPYFLGGKMKARPFWPYLSWSKRKTAFLIDGDTLMK